MRRFHVQLGHFAAVLALATLCVGCAPKGGAPPPAGEEMPESSATRVAPWPFQPTRIRIHPLTRIREGVNEQTGEPETYIDLQLDLQDQFGHSTKGIGELRFELYPAGEEQRSDRLEFWLIDISDLEVNRVQYDWVTRMYRINLVVPPQRLAQQRRFRLHAYLSTPGGQRMEHEAEVRWGGSGSE
jgi:hypothetical protein